MKVKFNNSKEAVKWLVDHPLDKLYDEYRNYVIWSPYSNVIEYWHYIGGEDEGYDPWDFDRLSLEEFINQFENIELESN